MVKLNHRTAKLKRRLVGIELNPGPKRNKGQNVRTSRRRPAIKPPAIQRVKKEKSLLSHAPAVGKMLGSYLGPLGAVAGHGLGTIVNKIWGNGDYQINNNSLLSGQIPVFKSNDRETVIAHREYIGDITGSTAFNNTAYIINPGLAQTFPWLSQVAAYYEQYEMLGLIFEYRPTSGTSVASANTALGVVVMATDYDVANPNFNSKQQMDSYEFSSSDVPYCKIIHPVECAPREKTLGVQYIRTGAVPAGEDLRFYDLGLFQIASQGQQSGVSTIGELWVSYHVRLLKPRIPPSGTLQQYVHILEGATGTAAAATLLGTGTPSYSVESNQFLVQQIVANATTAASNQFIMNTVGTYMIVLGFSTVAGDIAASPTLSEGSNITKLREFGDYAFFTVAGFATGGNSACIAAVVQVTGAGSGSANAVTIGGVTGLTAGSTDLYVYALPTAAVL